jgi:hypothetical protein
MKGLTTSLRVTTVALALGAIAVGGCKERKREPVPGPQTQSGASQAVSPTTGAERHVESSTRPGSHHTGVSGISWFQGTIEEAFSRTCTG